MHTKRRPGAPHGLFEWEVLGLDWLREAEPEGARIVQVIDWDDDHITEEALVPATPTAATAEDLGRRLAATHLLGAESFGATPPGWADERPGFIGNAALPTGSHDTWGRFYASERVLPFVRTAFDAGDLDASEVALFERVCERLGAGDFDDGRPPARLHGDLWSGNLVFTATGAVLIDPAAHGGHAETDLAMLALFGAPHLERIRAGWSEAMGPADGWSERTSLHQLHPLLVHTVLFGGSYAGQAVAAARSWA